MGKSAAVSTKTAAVEPSKRDDVDPPAIIDPPAGYTSTSDIGVGSRPWWIRHPPRSLSAMIFRDLNDQGGAV